MSKDELVEAVVELSNRVDKIEELTHALHMQNRKLRVVLAGSEDEFGTWDAESMSPLQPRIVQLEDQLTDHEDQFEMFVVEDGRHATPDERAIHLRQVLYNEAKSLAKEQDDRTATARLNRDRCKTALASSVKRAQVLDAMKRCADGSDAQHAERVDYTPIQGSSDLQPVDAITFTTGNAVGSTGGPEQSTLELSLADLTGTDLRKNHITVNGGVGAE